MKMQERKPGKRDFVYPFPADIFLAFNYTKYIFRFAFSGVCLQVNVDIYT